MSNWALSLRLGSPEPWFHDEFSYLLAADTFAHGRLTNPTHPLWQHFQSFHVLQHPTYMSKYPPAQGLILAVGQLLFGQPIFGVWLSVALMSAALCWMLYAWTSPRWAVMGGLIAVFHFGFLNYWSRSYWGGAMAALGGSLVFGALRRIFHKSYTMRNSWIMGLGLAVLANTRPYEGLIVSIPAAIALLWFILKKGAQLSWEPMVRNIVLPLFASLFFIAVGIGIYNKKVTGNFFLMPHVLYGQTHSRIRFFLWQPPRTQPAYEDPLIQKFEKIFTEPWYAYRKSKFKSIKEGAKFFLESFGDVVSFYLGPVLKGVMVMFPFLLNSIWIQFAFFGVVIPLTAGLCLISSAVLQHYYAPMTGLMILFVVESLRRIYCLDFKFRLRGAGKSLNLIFFAFLIFSAFSTIPRKGVRLETLGRGRILNQFKAIGGKHLVLVRYSSPHNLHQEWVYNGADIDGQQVVWARDMQEPQNRKLIDYFKDRKVWLIEADKKPQRLLEYPGIQGGTAPK